MVGRSPLPRQELEKARTELKEQTLDNVFLESYSIAVEAAHEFQDNIMSNPEVLAAYEKAYGIYEQKDLPYLTIRRFE